MSSSFQPTPFRFTPTAHTDTYPAIDPAVHSLNHKNRVVLVSGASKGIGRQTAASFARAGAAVIVLVARSNLDEVEKEVLAAAQAAGHPAPQVVKLAVDVTDSAGVAGVATTIREQFGGRLDVLVNNAGYLAAWKPVAESDEQEWWRTWEINLRGVYLMTKALLPLLLDHPDSAKVIVNVSSSGALRVRPGASAYQPSKFALLRFNEFLDAEYVARGLTAIAIHPGGVATELALNMPANLHPVLVDTPVLGADTIVWLTADNRAWLSGRFVSVNWDMPELEARKDDIVAGDKLKMKLAV